LLIVVPWKASTSAGKKTASLVDLVDVGPTVEALAGLPVDPLVDGKDVSALLDDPTAEPKNKQPAFHQYPACGCKVAVGDPYGTACFNATRAACNNAKKDSFNHMGYTMRTGPPSEYRYTAWFRWNGATLTSDFDGAYVAELYGHKGDDSTDMDSWENVNLAKDPAHAATANAMHAQLLAFFRETQRVQKATLQHVTETEPDTSDPYDI
jgi:arylsulfatase A-like enzyme